MLKKRESNYEGSIRKVNKSSYECVIQSKYFNDNGNPKRIKRRGPTPEVARERCKLALKEFEVQYEMGTEEMFSKTITFLDYANIYLEKEVKPNITGRGHLDYMYMIKACIEKDPIAKMKPSKLTVKYFENYYKRLMKTRTYSTARKPIGFCCRLCGWLEKNYIIPQNYAAMAVVEKNPADEFIRDEDEENIIRKKIFTPEDIKKFYIAFKNGLSIYAPIYIIMLESMMRSQEVLALTLDDIDFKNNTISVNKAISERISEGQRKTEIYIKVPKNGESRIVNMTKLCREAVEFLVEDTLNKCSNNYNNLLFPNYKTGELRRIAEMEKSFRKLCENMNIDRDVRIMPSGNRIGLNVHALRHTAITIANTVNGSNPVNTALMAGHRDISIDLNTYTHSMKESIMSVKTVSSEVLHYYEG